MSREPFSAMPDVMDAKQLPEAKRTRWNRMRRAADNKRHPRNFVLDVFYCIINNSDYLQKARKYGHFTGYKN